jgi:AraC-like DNA-binding protein
MKASFEAIQAADHRSFLVRKFEENEFSAPYHFHPEFELTTILRGTGKRYTGDHMDDFSAGDLVLLGAHLPHCWKTAAGAQPTPSASVVIQFQRDFLGKDFFNTPEMKPVLQLLEKSKQGLQFTGDTGNLQEQMITIFNEQHPTKKVLGLLDLLFRLATCNDYKALAKKDVYADLPAGEKKRMHAVTAYIVEHFQTDISLEKAAAAAHMTAPAFCKYFKKATRKTFIEAVTDYRIDFALQQLINSDKPVAQIGWDSGFNEVSNFYKTFKCRMGCSPLAYRRRFLQS